MNAAYNPSLPDRTRQILEDLEAVRENLLALSDDIWNAIDRQDLAAFDAGVQFIRTFIEKSTAFDQLATEISEIVQQYTRVRLASDEQTGADDREQNERLIRDLNRDEPHAVAEDLTYKRPHGFILDGQAAAGITTWRRAFELICQQLARRDSGRFHSLPDHPEFVSNRGHHNFTRSPEQLRGSTLIADGIYAEINLSANGLRDVIRRLLAVFEIPEVRLQLFLREDCNAAPANNSS